MSESEPVFIAGPTAVGKSEVAMELAEQLNGEIVSVDSMQVYRGLDIGTAKPSRVERERVPHHLLDVATLSESFDAARFCDLANRAEQAIRGRHRRVLFCGGTGLYFKAYLGGLGHSPPADAALRAELESTPLPQLLGELEARDPATFAAIDRNNPRRVVRAVEVLRLSGKGLSTQRADWSLTHRPTAFFALRREPADLRRRIEARVDRMFERGLVGEVERLLTRGLGQNRTAMQALGYRQVAEHLEGKRPLAETIELVKIRTWQFARRQSNWLRRHLQPNWIHVGPPESAVEVACRILERLKPTTAGVDIVDFPLGRNVLR